MDKQLLKSYIPMKLEIAQLMERMEELDAARTAPGVQHLTGMPAYHSGDNDRMAYDTAKAQELQELYKAKLAELVEIQLQIETAIASLDSAKRVLLRLRYIDGKRWEDICSITNYSWRQVHRLHGDALEELQNVDENEKMARNGTV